MKRLDRREAVRFGMAAAAGLATAAGCRRRESTPSTLPVASNLAGLKVDHVRHDRPDMVLIVADTVRADHLSCYGYGRPTTPNIDAFARIARRYNNVLAPGAFTLPSHASLFTGLPVSVHGSTHFKRYLDPRFPSLPEQLREAGYQTAGFSTNLAFLVPGSGFDRGFETYWVPSQADGPRPSLAMHHRLAEWFTRERDPDRPFFLFLNYIESHSPYEPDSRTLRWAQPELAEKWRTVNQSNLLRAHAFTGSEIISPQHLEELSLLYDEEVANVDELIGDLLGFLEGNGIAEGSLVAVTSDHGEHFGEHGLTFHQHSLYEALVRIPLVVRYDAALETGVDNQLRQLQDLYPTFLAAARAPWNPSPAHHCLNLLGETTTEDRLGVAEFLAPDIVGLMPVMIQYPGYDYTRLGAVLRVAQEGSNKLLVSSHQPPRLYDILEDPGEEHDLAASRPQVTRRLVRRLEEWLAQRSPFASTTHPSDTIPYKLTPDQIEALRRLGYL